MSAGKLTRSNKTWNVMLDQLYDNEADLFSLYYKKKLVKLHLVNLLCVNEIIRHHLRIVDFYYV